MSVQDRNRSRKTYSYFRVQPSSPLATEIHVDDHMTISGTGTQINLGVIVSSLSGSIIPVTSVAELRATVGDVNRPAVFDDLSRGGLFVWSDIPATDDDGTIFNGGGFGATSAGWRRSYSGALNVKWFNAIGDGFADDTTACQRALNAGDEVFFPTGRYIVTGLHALSKKHIFGSGIDKTILRHKTGSSGAVLWLGNNTQNTPVSIYEARSFKVHDLSIYMTTTSDWGLRCRELNSSHVYNMDIGDPYTEVGNLPGVALFVDGAINCLFHRLFCTCASSIVGISGEFRSSAVLNGGAGSGSGAGITSTKIISCYFRVSLTSVYATSLNNVTFDQCVFESCVNGFGLHDALKCRLLDCYFENITNNPVQVIGIDTRNHACIEVDGGWYQGDDNGGFIQTNGSPGKPFLYVENATRVVLKGIQAIAHIPITQLVSVGALTESIEIEANPHSFHTARQPTNTVSLANAIKTTLGSPNLEISWTSHGRQVGEVIDISGAASPLSNIAVNRPHWIITDASNINKIVVEPLLFGTTYLANATASNLGGAMINIGWYGLGDWTHLVIPNSHVKLTDCDYETVRFTATFDSITPISNGADLFYQGSPTYDFETYTYIISARLVTDQAITAPQPSVRYYQPILTGAGFDSYTLKLVDHSGGGDVGLNILPSDDLSHYRAFPEQSLSCRIFMSGDHPETFPRTETVEFLIAKTRYVTTVEA